MIVNHDNTHQGEFRLQMLLKHESDGEAAVRRQRAQAGITVAKHRGLFPSSNESQIAHATSSIDGNSNGGFVKDEFSLATGGGSNSTFRRPNQADQQAQSVQDISISMSQYTTAVVPPRNASSPDRSREMSPTRYKLGLTLPRNCHNLTRI